MCTDNSLEIPYINHLNRASLEQFPAQTPELLYMAFSKVGWSNETLRNHRTIKSHGLRMASHFDLTLRTTQKHLRFYSKGDGKRVAEAFGKAIKRYHAIYLYKHML